jgi:DNA-binding CsgD family transcriptional regulator
MRGLAVALGAVVANLPLYFAGLPVALLPDRAWAFLLAAGPAVPALVLKRQGGPVRPSVPWASILTLLVPIFFIYLVGGLMYALIVPTLSPLGQWMGVLPYILLLPVAGLLTWRGHRLWTGRLGPALLGLGYALWAFLPSAQREILSQVFIVGAFAFVDVFFWTLLADHRGPPSVAFGLGLGAMALAIYAGMALTDVVVLASAGREPLAAAAATVFLLLAVAFLPAWLPAVSQGQEAAFLVPDPGLSVKAGRWGLTEREAEVLRLVALGMSNKEIATRLGISGATVAKHLERIYRKMGVRGRTEALRYFLPTASGDPASGEGEG